MGHLLLSFSSLSQPRAPGFTKALEYVSRSGQSLGVSLRVVVSHVDASQQFLPRGACVASDCRLSYMCDGTTRAPLPRS